ncbi:MAG: cytochrome P450 [Actinomycetota bacterium]|nr:cytochrome P450 [Actinomycetota bacterium]
MTEIPVRDFDFHGPALDTIFDTYKELRDHCPVGWSDRYGGFWFLAKNEDIFNAEQDWATFSVAPSMLLPAFGTDEPMIPIDIDPPLHSAYRKLLLPLFTPRAVDALTPLVEETARTLADEVVKGEVADIGLGYARPLPSIIFCTLVGYPPEDWHMFDGWVDRIIYDRDVNPDESATAANEVRDYLWSLVERRRQEPPKDDITGRLITAQIDGRPITDEEILNYGYLLFLAGLDTTAWAIRSSLWYLARNPQDQERLRRDPGLISSAAEEFLRTMSPVQAMARTATKDVEVGGCPIKKGDRVVLAFGSGNRDEDAYPDPDEIIIDREENRHFAFGAGIHRCLGSNLGRREVIVALREFLDRVPPFEAVNLDEPWHGVGPLTVRFIREA